MDKPKVQSRYSGQITADCERVLVTLLRGLGPWRDSVFLVGGLAPRYIVDKRPPDVPAHAGTADVDIVVDVALLADTEAYSTLEENLKRMGFERAENRGKPVNWRWRTRTEHGAVLILEFLADDPKLGGGKLQELPTKGNVSAINIPHASMVFDLHDTREVEAELLGGGGRSREVVRYANLVSFTSLKAFAYDQRREPKDAHDLVYCLEHATGGIDGAIAQFRKALEGAHGDAIVEALKCLQRRFCAPGEQGYRMDGPVSVARFEIEGESDEVREAQALRQREASQIVTTLTVTLL